MGDFLFFGTFSFAVAINTQVMSKAVLPSLGEIIQGLLFMHTFSAGHCKVQIIVLFDEFHFRLDMHYCKQVLESQYMACTKMLSLSIVQQSTSFMKLSPSLEIEWC